MYVKVQYSTSKIFFIFFLEKIVIAVSACRLLDYIISDLCIL